MTRRSSAPAMMAFLAITVSLTTGVRDTITEVKTAEDATRVTVEVRVKRASGNGTDEGVVHDVDVTLKSPLAGRLVVDGTGYTVPRES